MIFKLFSFRIIAKMFIKPLLYLNNFTYKAISSCSMTIGNGKHLKKKFIIYDKWFLKYISTTDVIYDIGANNGDLTISLSKKASNVIAIEINAKQYQILKNNTKNISNIKIILGDATTFTLQEAPTKIVLSNVLEHIDKRIHFLSTLKKLYPDAQLLVRVPYKYTSWIVGVKELYNIEWRTDPEHYIEYSHETLTSELNESGWKLLEPILFDCGELYAVCN